MNAPVTRFVVQFPAANGSTRFVGEGPAMPRKAEEAKLFETKAEGLAAFGRIGKHHVRPGGKPSVRSRKVLIVKPLFMEMLGI